MRLRATSLMLATLLASAWALLGAPSAANAATHAGGSARASGPNVVKRAVTFQVKNVDTSALACPSDGAAYEVKGHLIGPASELGLGVSGGHLSVTLYLHDVSFGEYFWNFKSTTAALPFADEVLDRGGESTETTSAREFAYRIAASAFCDSRYRIKVGID